MAFDPLMDEATKEAAVAYSMGAVEGWIEGAINTSPTLINGDVALQNLQVIADGYNELRKNQYILKRLIQQAKGSIDAAATL